MTDHRNNVLTQLNVLATGISVKLLRNTSTGKGSTVFSIPISRLRVYRDPPIVLRLSLK